MTNKGRLLFYATLALFLVSIILLSSEILLLSLPLITNLLIGAFSFPNKVEIRAGRIISKTFVEAGEEVEVKVRVENLGTSTLQLSVYDPLIKVINNFAVKDMGKRSLNPGESSEFSYSFFAPRGRLVWKSAALMVADRFSLFERRIEIDESVEMAAVPKTRKIPESLLQQIETFPSPGLFYSGKSGEGSDYHSIEKYFPGVPLKRLNWRVSNRTPGRWLVNQFEKEEIGSFCLLVNAGIFSNDRELESELFESKLEAVCSISAHLIKTGNRVALAAFGENLSIVPSGAGPNHQKKIAVKLAGLRQGSLIRLKNFRYFPTNLFPLRSKIIVFSDISSQDLPIYESLMGKGYEVEVFSINSVRQKYLQRKDKRDLALAYRFAEVERQLAVRQFAAKGIPIYSINAFSGNLEFRSSQNSGLQGRGRRLWK